MNLLSKMSFFISLVFYFKFDLSDTRIAVPADFWFPFSWHIVFCNPSLSFCMYLCEVSFLWTACSETVLFIITSAKPCVLVDFNPFTFKASIDKKTGTFHLVDWIMVLPSCQWIWYVFILTSNTWCPLKFLVRLIWFLFKVFSFSFTFKGWLHWILFWEAFSFFLF